MAKFNLNGMRSFSTGIKLSSGMKRVEFVKTGSIYTPGYYITDSKEEVEALKKHTDFNRKFILVDDSVTEEVSEEGPVIEDNNFKEVEEVTKFTEARAYLNKEFGIPTGDVTNTEVALGFAREKEISFPNWNTDK